MGTRVFVGGLTYKVRERDIEKFFRKYGRIKEVAMKNGFAFVEFDDYRDADDAVYELNGKELLGERVSVERARGTPRGSDQWRDRGGRGYGPARGRSRDKYGPPTRTEYRLVVENLSSRVSWQDLKDFMRQAGEVTYADAHKQHRNEGVVEFATSGDMKNALDKLDDHELNGRRIRLVEDRRRSGGGGGAGGGARRSRSSSSRSRSRSRSKRRSRSRSRSRSHSRSRSRSRSALSRSRSPHSQGGAGNGGRFKSKSPAPSKSRSRSIDRSKELSKSRSRSRSKHSKSVTPKANNRSRSRSRSRSVSKERSRSRSRSPIKEEASPDKHDD